MRDYTNYYMPFKDKMVNDGNVFLQLAKNGLEGYEVTVNGVEKRVVMYDKYSTKEEKYVIDEVDSLKRGDIVVKGDEKWLIVSFDRENVVYKKWIAEKCNAQLKLKIGEDKVKVGDDALGRPIYETTILYDHFPCVVQSKTRLSSQSDGAINLPDGRVFIMMQYDSSLDLDVQSTFELYGQNWTVVELDMTGVENDSGVLGIMAEREG